MTNTLQPVAEVEIKCSADNFKLIPTDSVIPNPKNNNRHSIEQLQALQKLIVHHGFREPLTISNRSGFLNCGHARLEVAKALNMPMVPVIYQDFKSEAEEYQHMTADNEIARWARLDLHSIYDDIKLIPDLDTELLGIENFVIPEVVVHHTDEDSVPEKVEPVAKLGDVYILGKHRLMCGDSTSIDAVTTLMNGNRAQIAFTSPPYNAGDEVEIGSKGHKYNSHDDAMSSDGYLNLLKDFTTNSLMFCDLSIVNIQQLSGNKISFIQYVDFFKNQLVDIGIWNKTHGTPCLPRRVMNSAFEYVLFFSNEENPPKTIKTAPDFHGNVQNVYNGEKQRKNEFSKIHRATFPVHLPEYYISTFSTGDVIELFNGCGTTIIACEKLGRKCYAMELDPLYVDITVKRWEEFTGQKAVLEVQQHA